MGEKWKIKAPHPAGCTCTICMSEKVEVQSGLADLLKIEQTAFHKGYLEAMDPMMVHWPEDRKCGCDPVLSGQQGPTATTLIGQCTNYCWVQQVYQDAATKAGEVRT